MRITLEAVSTGLAYFPGLAKPVVLDAAALSPQEAEKLERLVDAAGASSPSAEQPPSAASRAADAQHRTLTVERDGAVRVFHLTDHAAASQALRDLFVFVQQRAKR